MPTLDDLEPLREHVQALPEGERDAAAERLGEEVAAKLVSDFMNRDGVMRRACPPVPVPDDGTILPAGSDGPVKVLDPGTTFPEVP